mgnify:FL=1
MSSHCIFDQPEAGGTWKWKVCCPTPREAPSGRHLELLSARYFGGPHSQGSLNAGRWPSHAARGTGTALAELRKMPTTPGASNFASHGIPDGGKSRERPGSALGTVAQPGPGVGALSTCGDFVRPDPY